MYGVVIPLLLLVLINTTALARVREIELNLSVKVVNPDCHTEGYEVMLVNGQHPAPPIQVTKGDEVRITINNDPDSDRETSIHYHGILQIGTTEADGMPLVTQAPIPPGGTFHANFKVIDQTGTYYYHAHSGTQDSSAHGPFIVYETDEDWPCATGNDNILSTLLLGKKKLHEGPYAYDDERVLFFSDWLHQDQQKRLEYLMGPNFADIGVTDSFLINGRTVYDPSTLQNDDSCEGYSAIDVEPGKLYRLRVIGATTFSAMNFTIAQHRMTIIEVDGVLIQPYETDSLLVVPGQRFSVLLRADQPPEDSYYISTESVFTPDATSNGVAILQSIVPKMFEPHARKATVPAQIPAPPPNTSRQPENYLFPEFRPVYPERHNFNSPPDRTIELVPVDTRMPDGTVRWLVNGRLAPEWSPSLIQLLQEMHQVRINNTAIEMNAEGRGDGFDDGHQTYPLMVDEVVDFVIQGTVILDDGLCPAHPWHTHGMVHYTIAHGVGAYVHARDKDIRTYPTPTAKDISLIYPAPPSTAAPGTPCSWTKFRVLVKNPGLWATHCHITAHMLQGMRAVMEVSPEQIPVLQNNDHF
ncbi:Cupredoxin [Zychaea mexicana]|uniref:Cupredoxin n=1 Tax=Zychaea mexicana TaxID=64656 RepID=UPI0022FDC402|nr:Cupredoxin [Zychaea mexicana]KAI9491897.1 Cupredoxin [Zychaea mexicana]